MEGALEMVRRVVARLDLMDARGDLVPLDSLSIVDLLVDLEAESQIEIPLHLLSHETFQSLDSIARVLDALLQSRR